MRRIGSIALVVMTLTACGGGNPGTGLARADTQHQTATVDFEIIVRGPAARARHPLFLPVNPASATIVVSPVGGTALPPVSAALTVGENTIPVTAPLGSDTFAVSLLDAHGNALAQGTTQPFTVVNDAQNVVPIVLDGVPATLALSITGTLTTGTAGSATVAVSAYDNSGDLILSPGNYSSPIALTDSDTAATSLVDTPPTGSGRSTQTGSSVDIVASNDAVTLQYNGGAVSGAHLSATVPGIPTVTTVEATFSSVAGSTQSLYALLSTGSNNGSIAHYSLPSGSALGSPVAVTFPDTSTIITNSLAVDASGRAYVGLADIVYPETVCSEECIEQIPTTGTPGYANTQAFTSGVYGVGLANGKVLLADSAGVKGIAATAPLSGALTTLNAFADMPSPANTIAFDAAGDAFTAYLNFDCTGNYPFAIDRYTNSNGTYANTPSSTYTTACPANGGFTLPPNQPPSLAIAADATGALLAGNGISTIAGESGIEVYATSTETITKTVSIPCSSYSGIAFDASDNLYVSAPQCNAVYEIASTATTATTLITSVKAIALYVR